MCKGLVPSKTHLEGYSSEHQQLPDGAWSRGVPVPAQPLTSPLLCSKAEQLCRDSIDLKFKSNVVT